MKTYDQQLKTLKGVIDDSGDFVLLEGLRYLICTMLTRESFEGFKLEVGALLDSHDDLVTALADADDRERRFEKLEDMEIIDKAWAEKGRM